MEHKLIRVEPADPLRCQARGDGGEGQCVFKAVEGQKTCPKHAGAWLKNMQDKKELANYRLQLWQQRVQEFACSEEVFNLRGEIGILRLQVEEILNLCTDANMLLIYSTRISDLVMKIERIVTTCSKIENRQGNLLDKSAALVLAGQIVDSISKHVKDASTVDLISSDLISLVARLSGKDLEDDSD